MKWLCAFDYLLIPVSPLAARVRLSLASEAVDGVVLDVCLASPEEALYTAAYDVRRYRGSELEITAPVPYTPVGSDTPCSYSAYPHPERPALRMTAPFGWLNDPNGLIFDGKRFHIFFQHNPVGIDHGNMHWHHLVTEDLVTFRDLGETLFPNRNGAKYSGSAFRMEDGSIGLYYTAAGGERFSQHIAISHNGGDSAFDDPTAEPITPLAFAKTRDPKVERDPAGGYVMSLFLDEPDLYAIYRSEDLLHWQETDRFRFEGDRECPGLFPLPLDGRSDDYRWVMMGANGFYRVGRLEDGKFLAETDTRRLLSGNLYAGQNCFDADGRCLRTDWLRQPSTDGRSYPWHGSLTFPYELKLVTRGGVPTVTASPIPELTRRLGGEYRYALATGERLYLPGKAYLLLLSFNGGEDAVLALRGATLTYSAKARSISFGMHEVVLENGGERIELLAILDTDGAEIFADGKVTAASVPRAGAVSYRGAGRLEISLAPISENVYLDQE